MVGVSRFKLPDRTLNKLFELFFEVVGKKYSKSEFQKTIFDLLSPVERMVIAKRIAIMYLVLKDIDYPTICHVLNVSMSTVAKYKLLMEKSEGVVPKLQELIKNEKIKLFTEELFNTLMAPGVPHVNWSAAWRRRMELERKKREGI